MRIIIYLASHDKQAVANYQNVRDDRRNKYQHQSININIEVRSGKLAVEPKIILDPFANIPSGKYDSVKIEFIAHGNPAFSSEVLSRRIDKNATPSQGMMLEGEHYDEVTPKMIFDFFNENENAKNPQTKEFKFKWLTIFACASDRFALELSGLLPNIYIISYKIPITINADGIACMPDGRTPAIPVIYLKSEPQDLQILDQYIFEFRDQVNIEDSLSANMDDFLNNLSAASPAHSSSASSSSSPLISPSSPSVSSSGHFSSSSSSQTPSRPPRYTPAAETPKKNKFKPS